MRATLDRVAFRQPLVEQAKPTWALDPDRVLNLPFWNMPDGEVYLSQDAYGHTVTRYGATPTGQGGWSFDGSDDYVLSANSETDLTTFTVEAWIKPSTVGVSQTVVSHGASPADTGWSVRIPAESRLRLTFHGVGNYNSNADILSVNVWQHVAVTLQGTTATFYLNGSQKGTATTGTMSVGSHKYATGASPAGGNPFNGSIGEVPIDNRVLSAGEIWNDFQRSRHMFGV